MIALTREQAEALLQRSVGLYNAGVRSGDFHELLDLFTDDGVLEIEGIPDGPLVGRAAIARRFAADPPDDEIRVTRFKAEGNRILAEFVWTDIPEARGGCLIFELREQKIARLIIAFGGPDKCFG
jgi:hypothetical protein